MAADLARPAADRRLLGDLGDGSEAATRTALADLQFRVFGEREGSDSPRIDALLAVYEAAGGEADPETAWTAVVYAVLRDPRILYY